MRFLPKAGLAGLILLSCVGTASALTGDYKESSYVYGSGSGMNASGHYVSNLDYDQWYVYGEGDARYVMLYPQEIARRFPNGIILKDVQAAIDYVSMNKISKYGTADTFHPEWNVRRDEVAAMFRRSQQIVAPEVEGLGLRLMPECDFSDNAQAHADLKIVVKESCQVGLFKGSNGKFRPTAEVTNAEAIAVLVRMVSGEEVEPTNTHWAANYYKQARQLGFLGGLAAESTANLDKPITRGDVAKLLEAASVYIQAEVALKASDGPELMFDGESNQYQLEAK